MKYKFPYITHIDHVLPFIKDREEFIVGEREGYKVINYVVSHPDTFSGDHAPILRECRGIIFDSETGRILRRPYHKFFNLGEKEETFPENIDFSQKHVIYEKIDGSMIVPFFVQGYIRWGTKMGLTDVAMQAEEFIAQNPKYMDFARLMLENDYTPIFEWVSPKQRIVLDYKKEDLILTAIRHTKTGDYLWDGDLDVMSTTYGIPMAGIQEIDWRDVASKENEEGIVVRFDTGHMIKVKTEWYCRIHKCKEKITRENDVIDLWLNNGLDDVLAFLPKDDKDRITKFISTVNARLWNTAQIWFETRQLDMRGTGRDRKTYALDVMPHRTPTYSKMMFKMFDADTEEVGLVRSWLVDYVRNHVSNSTKYMVMKNELFRDIEF